MPGHLALLERYGVAWHRGDSEDLGRALHEDAHQIGVEPRAGRHRPPEQGHAGAMDEKAAGQAAEGSDGLPGEVVFEGAHADMTWRVRVHGDGADLHSMLHLHRGTKTLAGSGMGGPPLPRTS